eukprot:3323859-Pleurochrysis_carterae.AAC.8
MIQDAGEMQQGSTGKGMRNTQLSSQGNGDRDEGVAGKGEEIDKGDGYGDSISDGRSGKVQRSNLHDERNGGFQRQRRK